MKMGSLMLGTIADLNMVILSSNIIWMQTNMKFNKTSTAVLMDNQFTIITTSKSKSWKFIQFWCKSSDTAVNRLQYLQDNLEREL
jgi:hypothetical protein